MASAGTIEVPIRVTVDGTLSQEAGEFLKAVADAHREAKRVRQDVRHLDRRLADLLDKTHRLFGIELTKGAGE